jgi:tetratricopeptide (TPR) repeat protein
MAVWNAKSSFFFGSCALFFVGCASVPPLPPQAVTLNQRGAEALAAGDLETAEASLSVALEFSPKFTEAWINRGYVSLLRHDFAGARKYFVQSRDLNADLPAPHHALGLLAQARGIPSEAEAHYRQALKVDPGFVPARSNLARLLFQRAAYALALEQFRRLSEVSPDALDGHLGIVESLLKLAREDDADDVLVRARARFGDSPELLLLVGRQLLRREAYVDAEAVLAPLTKDEDPGRAAAAWSWIGVCRLGRLAPDDARSAAAEALALDRDNAVARFVQREAASAPPNVSEGARTPSLQARAQRPRQSR